MLGFLKQHAERFRYYDTVTSMTKIVRRYFAMNSFDGALTLFGLLLGSFAAGVSDASLIIKIGFGTAVAIGFSGLAGALMTERAERLREVKRMELALHRRLDNTDYKKAYDFATLITGVVNGLSPLFSAVLLLSPFLFVPLPDAYYYAFAMAFGLFFFLGVFLGAVSRENLFITGMKFLGAGVLCMIIILFLEHIGQLSNV
jgi:predicted membrane protein (TIGR00267 family)